LNDNSAFYFSGSVINMQVVKSNQSTPILQCHGDADPLVTHEFGKMASEMISTFNNHLQFKTYPGLAHCYCPQVFVFCSLPLLVVFVFQTTWCYTNAMTVTVTTTVVVVVVVVTVSKYS